MALSNQLWMRGLQRIDSQLLMERVHQPLGKDAVSQPFWGTWYNSLGADLIGQYSAAPAYNFQFLTCVKEPLVNSAWHIKSEPKVKFYVWLLIQKRNWTADRLGLTTQEVFSLWSPLLLDMFGICSGSRTQGRFRLLSTAFRFELGGKTVSLARAVWTQPGRSLWPSMSLGTCGRNGTGTILKGKGPLLRWWLRWPEKRQK